MAKIGSVALIAGPSLKSVKKRVLFATVEISTPTRPSFFFRGVQPPAALFSPIARFFYRPSVAFARGKLPEKGRFSVHLFVLADMVSFRIRVYCLDVFFSLFKTFPGSSSNSFSYSFFLSFWLKEPICRYFGRLWKIESSNIEAPFILNPILITDKGIEIGRKRPKYPKLIRSHR